MILMVRGKAPPEQTPHHVIEMITEYLAIYVQSQELEVA